MLLRPVLNSLAVTVAYFGCKIHHGRLCVQHIHWSVQETCALQVQINRSSTLTAQVNLPLPRSGTPQRSALLRAFLCLKSIKSLLCSANVHPCKMKSGNVFKQIKNDSVRVWSTLVCVCVWTEFKASSWVICVCLMKAALNANSIQMIILKEVQCSAKQCFIQILSCVSRWVDTRWR